MRMSTTLKLPRRIYADLDYARHMPTSYVNRAKYNVPMKDFNNRFGAPNLIKWHLPPEEHIDVAERPWQQKYSQEAFRRAELHRQHQWSQKYFKINYRKVSPLPPEKWTIFPGDTVQVMVGRDKGKQGIVSHVIREQNAVFVDGLHTKLVKQTNPISEKRGIPPTLVHEMMPLDPTKNQVKLVDPNDHDTCEVKWIESKEDLKFVRISERTGYQIPLPSQAYITYEYVSKNDYIESTKDTPSGAVLRSTYNPQKCLKTFEDELKEEYGIKEDRQPLPTYWY